MSTCEKVQFGEVPQDFSSRFPSMHLAAEAVQAAFAVKPGASTFDWRGQSYSESMLLSVICHAYACGIYSSREIEQKISEDETLRYLCARSEPDSEVLRHFRRNRPALVRATLIELLCALWPASSDPDLLHDEAERRLARAVQADSIALDD